MREGLRIDLDRIVSFVNPASSSCETSQKPECGRMTKKSGAISSHRFPREVIGYAVWA